MQKQKKQIHQSQLLPKIQYNNPTKHIPAGSSAQPIKIKGKKITLSSQLDWDGNNRQHEIEKICVVHRNINVLDRICNSIGHQFKSQKIRYLYLSNNFIQDIQNIQQFPNLQTLSLTYNQITKLTNIRYLSALSRLAYIGLQGNPISKSPLYLAYIVGVTTNSNCMVKKVDSINFTCGQYIMNWDVYEQSMGQMIRNYLKLIFLTQMWKKLGFHRIIIIANSKISPQNTQKLDSQQIIGSKIEMYIEQSQEYIKQLTPKYIIKIQDILFQDITTISQRKQQQYTQGQCRQEGYQQHQHMQIQQHTSGRRQKLSSLQIFFGSMYELLQKQKEKIVEIKQRICHKYIELYGYTRQIQSSYNQSYQVQDRQSSQNQFLEPMEKRVCQIQLNNQQRKDIEKAEQLLQQSMFKSYKKSKQQLYYQWKLLGKILNRIKVYSSNRNRMKYSCISLGRILKNIIRQKFVSALNNMKNMAKFNIIDGMVNIINNKYSLIQKDCIILIIHHYKISKQEEDESHTCHAYMQILENRKRVRKIWKQWKKLHSLQKMKKQNKKLSQQIINYRKRQQKLTNKLQLLQKLLELTQKKLAQAQSNHNSPKWLLKQLEKDCQNLKTIPSSPQSRIRKNKMLNDKQISDNQYYEDTQSSIDKQNNHLSNNMIVQRKFNSSRKYLRIDKSNN